MTPGMDPLAHAHSTGHSPSWIADVRSLGVFAAAEAFGFVANGRTIAPCPACSAEQRGRTIPDRRGPVGVTADGLGFRCHRCQAHGDAVALAALAVLGTTKPARDQWRELHDACTRAGLCESEIPVHPGAFSARARPVTQHSQTVLLRPARDQVIALWSCSQPVSADDQVCDWLRSRGIDPCRVEDLELARALPLEAPVPAWARSGTGSWTRSQHRLVLPLHDELGAMVSLHARAIVDAHPKSLSPAGCALAGLVMADSGGMRMLAGGGWQPGCVWIAEGVPDFLTLACDFNESDDESAALGIVSGSWTETIAARVPDGCRVVIATHDDEQGERYAEKIATTLGDRAELLRWHPRNQDAPK